MPRLKASPALLFGLLLASAASFAAQPPAGMLQPLRGTIQQAADDHLQLQARNGQQLTVRLTDKTAIRAVSLAKPEDIQPDSFIGTAAVPQPDGTLKALEVHVFAPSLRGSGEGHRPWENADGSASTMTNGTVGNLVVSQGRRMTVKYGDGEKTVVVPDDVPIVSLEPGERSLLKPGAKVVLFPQKGADGSLTALAISVGKDGVTPPM
ncbi:TPA: hypothetical protein ACXJVL_000494 [Pseudomonas aeruginosa]